MISACGELKRSVSNSEVNIFTDRCTHIRLETYTDFDGFGLQVFIYIYLDRQSGYGVVHGSVREISAWNQHTLFWRTR